MLTKILNINNLLLRYYSVENGGASKFKAPPSNNDVSVKFDSDKFRVKKYNKPQFTEEERIAYEIRNNTTVNPRFIGKLENYKINGFYTESAKLSYEKDTGVIVNPRYAGKLEDYDPDYKKKDLPSPTEAEIQAFEKKNNIIVNRKFKGKLSNYKINFKKVYKKPNKQKVKLIYKLKKVQHTKEEKLAFESKHSIRVHSKYRGKLEDYRHWINFKPTRSNQYDVFVNKPKGFTFEKDNYTSLGRIYFLLKTNKVTHYAYKVQSLLDLLFFWFFLVYNKNQNYYKLKKLNIWLNIYILLYINNTYIFNKLSHIKLNIWSSILSKGSYFFLEQNKLLWFKSFNKYSLVYSGVLNSVWDIFSLYWNQYTSFHYNKKKSYKFIIKKNISFFVMKHLINKSISKKWVKERTAYNWWEKRQKRRLNLTIYELFQQQHWLKYKYNFDVGENLSIKSKSILRKKQMLANTSVMLVNLNGFTKQYNDFENSFKSKKPEYSFKLKTNNWI